MVLAERMEGDRPFDDLADEAVGITTALSGKRRQQLVVAVVARSRVVERLEESLRGAGRCRAVDSHPKGREDFRDRLSEAQPVLRFDVPRRGLLDSFFQIHQLAPSESRRSAESFVCARWSVR